MTKQVLIHCAAHLAPLYKAAPELLHIMRGVAEYLDQIEVLHRDDPCHLLAPGHTTISKHVGSVLRKTRTVHLSIRVPPASS